MIDFKIIIDYLVDRYHFYRFLIELRLISWLDPLAGRIERYIDESSCPEETLRRYDELSKTNLDSLERLYKTNKTNKGATK